jgi:hypothetical protein
VDVLFPFLVPRRYSKTLFACRPGSTSATVLRDEPPPDEPPLRRGTCSFTRLIESRRGISARRDVNTASARNVVYILNGQLSSRTQLALLSAFLYLFKGKICQRRASVKFTGLFGVCVASFRNVNIYSDIRCLNC